MDYYRDQRIESVVSTVDNEDLSQIDGRHVIVPNVESRYDFIDKMFWEKK